MNLPKPWDEWLTDFPSSKPIYLVGGSLRDLLLNLPIADIDLMSETRADKLAGWWQRRYGGIVENHPRFLTSTWHNDDLRLDFVRARREVYLHPGKLPRVYPGNIETDLARRDFSVNAMACPISALNPKNVIDLFNGLADLKEQKLRVLHDRSFYDDPTRIWRLIRFTHRLGFFVEPHTMALLEEALGQGVLDLLSSGRRAKEKELCLKVAPMDFWVSYLPEWPEREHLQSFIQS